MELDDVPESLEKIAVADAHVTVIFLMNRRESQLDSVVEEVLRVLRTQALAERGSRAPPFVREIARFLQTADQHVRKDCRRAHQGFQIILDAVFPLERGGLLARFGRGNRFHGGS